MTTSSESSPSVPATVSDAGGVTATSGRAPVAVAPAEASANQAMRAAVHDALWSLRRVLSLGLLGLVVFAVLMPVSTAAVPQSSVFTLAYTHDQLRFRFFAGPLTPVVLLATVAFGISLGVALFRFALVRDQAAAVFSLGLGRVTLFCTRLVVGTLVLAVCLLVPLAVALLLNCLALGVTPGVVGQCAAVGAGLLVLGLISLAAAALSCLVAGTVAEALAFCAALLGSVTVATWGLNAVMSRLLVGNGFGALTSSQTTTVAPSLVSATSAFNPVLAFDAFLRRHAVFWRHGLVPRPPAVDWRTPVLWLAVIAALVVAAAVSAERRRSENAGIAGSALAVDLFACGVIGFGGFAVVFHLLASAGIGAALAAGVVTLVLVGLALMRGPQRERAPWSRTSAVVAGQTVVVLAVVAVVASGGLGYSGRVPSPASVASVTVSYTGSPEYLAVPVAASSVGRSYYFIGGYTYDTAAAVRLVERVHHALIGDAHQPLATAVSGPFADTVVPYDIVITYRLRDGGHLTRYYDRARLADLAALLHLDDLRGVRTLERALITGDLDGLSPSATAAVVAAPGWGAYRSGQVVLADRWYSHPETLSLSVAERAGLLAAIARDVTSQPAAARYFPRQPAAGVIAFTGDPDTAMLGYQFGDALVYLTPDMTATLAFLRSHGLAGELRFHGSIQSLTFEKYEPYGGMARPTSPADQYFLGYRSSVAQDFWTQQDFGLRLATNDPAQIAQIVPRLRATYFLSDGGYLVAAKIAGSNVWAYCYLPAAEAPGYVRKGAL